MKKSKITLLVSIGFFILGIIILIVSFMLNIGNTQYAFSTMSPFSNLKAIYVLRFIFANFLFFSVTLFVSSIISIVKKRELKNGIILFISILFLFSVVTSVCSILLNYNSNSVYGDYILNDGHYDNIFPYYEEMKNDSSQPVYSTIEENHIYSSRYICLQSSSVIGEDDILYDVDYFESENDVLLGQFIAQNAPPDSALLQEGEINGSSYQIYTNDFSCSILIENDHSLFSMYLMNFNKMDHDANKNKLVEKAYEVFQNVSASDNLIILN